MDERVRFVAGLLEGEKMAPLCRAFGISRETGYKIFSRYKEMGIEGLTDRSRRPCRHANQLPFQIETLIVSLKKEQPSWGAPKIREKLMRLHPHLHAPAVSTVHAVLDRHGLVKRRKRRRPRAQGTAPSQPDRPNDLWCADYKGELMLADKRYCYPLTVTDHESRFLFASVGAAGGTSLPIIGALLGHTQVTTTQWYAHLSDDPLRAASDAIATKVRVAMGDAPDPGELVRLNR